VRAGATALLDLVVDVEEVWVDVLGSTRSKEAGVIGAKLVHLRPAELVCQGGAIDVPAVAALLIVAGRVDLGDLVAAAGIVAAEDRVRLAWIAIERDRAGRHVAVLRVARVAALDSLKVGSVEVDRDVLHHVER
jgi:hypothetical protein